LPAEPGNGTSPPVTDEGGRDPEGRPLLPDGFRHDILNDLNAVTGYGMLLEIELPDGPLRTMAGRLLQAARHAQSLVEALPRRKVAPRPHLLLVLGASTSDDSVADRFSAQADSIGWELVRALTAGEAASAVKAAPSAWRAILADPALPGISSLRRACTAAGIVLHELTAADRSDPVSLMLSLPKTAGT
jgi:hypothetical protein